MKIAEGTFAGLHPKEEALFREVLKGMTGVGVEIGCLDGYSSAVILDASELHLTSIDPFIPDSMEKTLIGSEAKYRENVKPFGPKRSKLYKEYAQHLPPFQLFADCGDFDEEDQRVQFDFLFIDGDHTYPAVLRDFEAWTPALKMGGILAIHDARMSREGGAGYHPGPSKVAKEQLFDRPDLWDIVGEAHSLVIARKR